MDTEQIKEWSNFEQRAIELVRKGNVPDEIGMTRLLQIMIIPSFDTATSWEIWLKSSRLGGSKYVAVTTSWNRYKDLKKFETPLERLKHPRALNPSIETTSFELAGGTVEGFLYKLKSVFIPAYTDKETIGTDGTVYEFSFGDLFLSAKYSWWEKPPVEWKSLGDAILDLLKELEGLSNRETEEEVG